MPFVYVTLATLVTLATAGIPCVYLDTYVTMWVGASQSEARQPIRTSLSETKEAVYRPMRGAQLGWGTDYGRNIGQQWQKCKSKYQVLANLTALQIYFEGQLESAPDKPWSYAFNILAPERCGSNSKSVIFHFLLEFEFLSTSCLNPIDEKSMLF